MKLSEILKKYQRFQKKTTFSALTKFYLFISYLYIFPPDLLENVGALYIRQLITLTCFRKHQDIVSG